jgi:heavy metal translocating P-type ATPase
VISRAQATSTTPEPARASARSEPVPRRPAASALGDHRWSAFLASAVAACVVAGVLQLSGAPVASTAVLLGLALAAIGWQGWRMLRALIAGRVGLDVLALAAIISTLAVGEPWAAAVIVLMLAGGQALEASATGRAGRELRALLERAPRAAHRLGADGTVADVDPGDIVPGDLLLVRPGETVPVDLLLDSGPVSVDESSITGESLPVDRGAGETVPSGVVLLGSAVTGRASATAADSAYQRIVLLVAGAAESRAPLVRLADRYAVPFTAVAFAIAGIGWAISGDPVRFAEVLVVATPCPLLLAAPIAFVAGMGRAARASIVVKSGGSLELLSRVRTVAFDKTGTLTSGKPAVHAVLPAAGRDEDEVLRLAASAEQYSGHVLADAVLARAKERHLSLPAASANREVTAGGVVATVDGHEIVAGKRGFLVAAGVEVPPPPVDGSMSVDVAVDRRYAGRLLLADPPRLDAAEVVAALPALGVRRVVMVTGDAETTAMAVAGAVGITRVHSSCLPEDKVRIVRDERERPVLMVGDGVNDAPVLAAADLGVAMGAHGSAAASESADVVLLVDELGRLPVALSIGTRTTTVARQAIVLGIAMSVVLMLVAITGVIPAVVGALLQEAVDLATILSALRARTAGHAARDGGRPDRPRAAAAEGPATSARAG